MTVIAQCPWCKQQQTVVTGYLAVVCQKCHHSFYTPLESDVDSMLKCSQCDRRCTEYADLAGKRCLICVIPPP